MKHVLVAALFFALPAAAYSIPGRPFPTALLDEAGALSAHGKDRIADQMTSEMQVAVIARVSDHGAGSIQSLARDWLRAWGGSSRSVLVLVSTADRQARIEMGSAWGPSGDRIARDVMDRVLVPACKRGDVEGGVADAVHELAVLQAQGPGNVRLPSTFSGFGARAGSYSMLPKNALGITTILGFIMLALAFVSKGGRAWLIGGGVLLLFFGFFTKVFLIVLIVAILIVTRGGGRSGYRRSRWGSSSSYRSSSRSISRGATGSW